MQLVIDLQAEVESLKKENHDLQTSQYEMKEDQASLLEQIKQDIEA